MFNCLASGRMAETDVTDSLELRKSKKKIDSRFKRLKRFTLLHTYVGGENPTNKIFPTVKMGRIAQLIGANFHVLFS